MKNKFSLFVVLIAFFFSVNLLMVNVRALEEKKGLISICLERGSKDVSVNEVEFELVKVADLVNGEYLIDSQLKELNVNLNDIESASTLQNNAIIISNYFTKNNISGCSKKTNSAGQLEFNDLTNGVYLLRALDINEYDNVSPTLIAIPTIDNGEVNGVKYEVEIIPKHSPIVAVKTEDDYNLSIMMMFGILVIIPSVLYVLR